MQYFPLEGLNSPHGGDGGGDGDAGCDGGGAGGGGNLMMRQGPGQSFFVARFLL